MHRNVHFPRRRRFSRCAAVLTGMLTATLVLLPAVAPAAGLADQVKDKALSYSKEQLLAKLATKNPKAAELLGKVDAENWSKIAGMIAGGDYSAAIQKAWDDNNEAAKTFLLEALKKTQPKLAAALEAIDPAFWSEIAGDIVEGDYSAAADKVAAKAKSMVEAGVETALATAFPPLGVLITVMRTSHAAMLYLRGEMVTYLLGFEQLEKTYRESGRDAAEFSLDFGGTRYYAVSQYGRDNNMTPEKARAKILGDIQKKLDAEKRLELSKTAIATAKRNLRYSLASAQGTALQEMDGMNRELANQLREAARELDAEHRAKSQAQITIKVTAKGKTETPSASIRVVPEDQETTEVQNPYSWYARLQEAYDVGVQVFNDTLQAVTTKVKVFVDAYGCRSEERELTVTTDTPNVLTIELEPIEEKIEDIPNPYVGDPPGSPPPIPTETDGEISSAFSSFQSGEKTYSEYGFVVWEARRKVSAAYVLYSRWYSEQYRLVRQISDYQASLAAWQRLYVQANAWHTSFRVFIEGQANLLESEHKALYEELHPVLTRMDTIIIEMVACRAELLKVLREEDSHYYYWWHQVDRSNLNAGDRSFVIDAEYSRDYDRYDMLREDSDLWSLRYAITQLKSVVTWCATLQENAEKDREHIAKVLPVVQRARQDVDTLADEYRKLFEDKRNLMSAPNPDSSHYAGYAYWYGWYWRWSASGDTWTGYDYSGPRIRRLEERSGGLADLELYYDLKENATENTLEVLQEWFGKLSGLLADLTRRQEELLGAAKALAAEYRALAAEIPEMLVEAKELLEKVRAAASSSGPNQLISDYDSALRANGKAGAFAKAQRAATELKKELDAHSLNISSLGNDVQALAKRWQDMQQRFVEMEASEAYRDLWAAGEQVASYRHYELDTVLRDASYAISGSYRPLRQWYEKSSSIKSFITAQTDRNRDARASVARAMAACNSASALDGSTNWAQLKKILGGFDNEVVAVYSAARTDLGNVRLAQDDIPKLGPKLDEPFAKAREVATRYQTKIRLRPGIDSFAVDVAADPGWGAMQLYREDLQGNGIPVRGAASTQGYPIQYAEISADGGQTWTRAKGTAAFTGTLGVSANTAADYRLVARAVDQPGQAGNISMIVEVHYTGLSLVESARQALSELNNAYTRQDWSGMLRWLDQMEYAGDFGSLEESVEAEFQAAAGGGIRLQTQTPQVKRQANFVAASMDWTKNEDGKTRRGRCEYLLQGGKVVFVSGDVPYGRESAAGGGGGSYKVVTVRVTAGGGVDLSRGMPTGIHDPNADFEVFAWTGGGEIFSAAMSLLEADEDFNDMHEAPLSGYNQFVNFDAGACFYVKTREGHYAKVQIMGVQGDTITFKCAYRPDGKRSF